jgi:hypothetical protein
MEIAMTLPTMVPHSGNDTRAWCRSIDEGPWSSLAVPERITFPSHAMVVELSAAAALTERVRLVTPSSCFRRMTQSTWRSRWRRSMCSATAD